MGFVLLPLAISFLSKPSPHFLRCHIYDSPCGLPVLKWQQILWSIDDQQNMVSSFIRYIIKRLYQSLRCSPVFKYRNLIDKDSLWMSCAEPISYIQNFFTVQNMWNIQWQKLVDAISKLKTRIRVGASVCAIGFNKLASLEATLVQNFDLLTNWPVWRVELLAWLKTKTYWD